MLELEPILSPRLARLTRLLNEQVVVLCAAHNLLAYRLQPLVLQKQNHGRLRIAPRQIPIQLIDVPRGVLLSSLYRALSNNTFVSSSARSRMSDVPSRLNVSPVALPSLKFCSSVNSTWSRNSSSLRFRNSRGDRSNPSQRCSQRLEYLGSPNRRLTAVDR